MNPPSRPRLKRLFAVLTIGTLLLSGGYLALSRFAQAKAESESTVLLHSVQREDFVAFVTEPGDVDSSSNVDVRCLVESRGTSGTSIVKICDEGIRVKEGDFLAQFDDSLLQQELISQKIVVAKDKAALIQAESDRANAERTLKEFADGLFFQQIEILEAAVFVAEEEQRKSELELNSAFRMAAKGSFKSLQVSASQFALEKTRKDVAASQRALEVYSKFTRDKMIGEYKAEIEKQKANVEAAQYTIELSAEKLKSIEGQIAACTVTAPSAGQVVYANDRDRGNSPMVVEEGASIRFNQVFIRLPDLQRMQVNVKINESHVNRIKEGHLASIELDADPGVVLSGEVKSIAPFPFPMRWHGAPLEYGVEVSIVDPPSTIRPGLRAKVKIFYDSFSDVLQVPLASIIAHEDTHYSLVMENGQWKPREVKIGTSNSSMVVVAEGLSEGEQVALTPFEFIKRSDLPTVASRAVTQKPSELSSSARLTKKLTTESREGS
jgi:HlyD family secretion protein